MQIGVFSKTEKSKCQGCALDSHIFMYVKTNDKKVNTRLCKACVNRLLDELKNLEQEHMRKFGGVK